jgi:hypothetical protein
MEALLKHSDTRSPVTGEQRPLGLTCTPSGLSLAGAPLLHRTAKGFDVRPGDHVAELLKCAYGVDADLGGLAANLNLAARRLGGGVEVQAGAKRYIINMTRMNVASY